MLLLAGWLGRRSGSGYGLSRGFRRGTLDEGTHGLPGTWHPESLRWTLDDGDWDWDPRASASVLR
jgi:hypothetical protein